MHPCTSPAALTTLVSSFGHTMQLQPEFPDAILSSCLPPIRNLMIMLCNLLPDQTNHRFQSLHRPAEKETS